MVLFSVVIPVEEVEVAIEAASLGPEGNLTCCCCCWWLSGWPVTIACSSFCADLLLCTDSIFLPTVDGVVSRKSDVVFSSATVVGGCELSSSVTVLEEAGESVISIVGAVLEEAGVEV